MKNEINRLLRRFTNIRKEVERRIKTSTYADRTKIDINKSDLLIVAELYEKIKPEKFQDYIKSIDELFEKSSVVLYVSTMIRKMLPPEHFISFAKNVCRIDVNNPDKAVREAAKVIVERNEVEKIREVIRKYLVSTGMIVDIVALSPDEIRKEFENDQKYPNVESIREKLPDEYKSIIKRNIKKKSTAINKIIEEIEKIRSVRKLGSSPL
ncbi:MAG: hypothetical protein RMI79_04425 [Nitrososphaerota archaeon]|nr:hypothetical protein [Nitrososphaerota archaeon]